MFDGLNQPKSILLRFWKTWLWKFRAFNFRAFYKWQSITLVFIHHILNLWTVTSYPETAPIFQVECLGPKETAHLVKGSGKPGCLG